MVDYKRWDGIPVGLDPDILARTTKERNEQRARADKAEAELWEMIPELEAETALRKRAEAERDALLETGSFLLERLVDHEVRMTSDEDAREWHGHVTPAMARFRALIQPGPDPLVEVFVEAFRGSDIGKIGGYWEIEKRFREALARHGLAVKEVARYD